VPDLQRGYALMLGGVYALVPIAVLVQTSPPHTLLARAERWVHEGARWLAHGVEVIGVLVLVYGVATALLEIVPREDPERSEVFRRVRTRLGRALLLGLEFLVVADVIATVAVESTFRSLGVLAVLVAIRTFLSFALEAELEGHWPWERDRPRERSTADAV
jgi:uncharacterized membrane protein